MRFNSSEQNISWFRDQYQGGAMTIRPPYQRKPVWAERQKSSLIESILLEYPVPEIFVQQTVDDQGSARYAVVDGQQRIRTVLQFMGSEIDPEAQDANEFVLTHLSPDSPYLGLGLRDFDEVSRRRFYSYKFGVRFLDTDDEAEVRSLFTRLNK
jgi:hypothetical protein